MANFIAPLTPVGLAPLLHLGQAQTIGYATTAERLSIGLLRIRHHGSAIADIHYNPDLEPTLIWVSNAGYDSMTTRDRLNQVLRDNGVPAQAYQRKGVQVLWDCASDHDNFREATFQLRHGQWQLTRFNAQPVEEN